MKRWKRIGLLSLGAMAVLLFAAVILPALAMENDSTDPTGIVVEENVIASGNVTDTVTWRVTEDDTGERTLIIGGTGPMADYTSGSQQPWQEWNKNLYTLIVEDGVTRIGNNSMYGMGFKEVQIGKGVESIGKHAFAYGTNMEHIRIPGNVKVIEANAFVFHYSLYSATLEEGVEEIGHSAFGGQAGKGSVFHIPSSVKHIADLACWTVTGYTVAEDNPYYSAVDGVLYNKDQTALVDYPKYKVAAEYRIPNTVCEIVQGSLQRISSTRKIYIPSSVQTLPGSFMMRWSGIEEVYVEDGVPFPADSTFYGCGSLRSVRLPENIQINLIQNMVHYGCNSLESLKIPNSVKKIAAIGWPTKALTELTYDASEAVIQDNQIVDTDITYKLTIGENVDDLPAEFQRISAQAEQVRFQGTNQFRVEAGAFESLDSPLKELEGTVYVDGQGVLYRYSAEEGTAQVVYCQSGYEEIFLPSKIQPEEGVICKVTSVGQYAFREAEGVRTVTFEAPEQMISIEAYGFAYCGTLSEVNGCTTVKDAAATFSTVGDNIDYRAFYQTGLLSVSDSAGNVEDMKNCEELKISGGEVSNLTVTVASEGDTLEWNMEEEDGTGRYSLLTGDTMTILASAGNREAQENFRYRIYFQWTESDCVLSVKPGETYTFEGQTVSCCKTEDPNCLYIEFMPLIGKTLSIPITALYPSPSSGGGGLTVWAVILNDAEADGKKEQLVLSNDGAIQLNWVTVRDDFKLTKTSSGSSSITLKGTAEGSIIPGSNLEWKIVLQRENGTTSAYGKDYVRSVSYRDVMTLPSGISWQEEVIKAIQDGNIRRSGNYWYAGEKRVFYLGLSGGQLNLSAVRLEWNEEIENAVLTYSVTNSSRTAQMNTNTLSYILYAEALSADTSVFNEEVDNVVTNIAEASVRYEHSDKTILSSSAVKTLKVGSGSMNLTKTTVKAPYYFGEPVHYEISLNNPGALPYIAEENGSWSLKDTLSPYTYIKPEDMEKMFEEDESKSLTITITGAELVKWEEQQGIYEDTVFWQNGANSGENLPENATETIVIGWNSERTGIQAKTDKVICEEATLADSLKQLGYAPGRWTEYTVLWTLNEEEAAFTLNAGEEKEFMVYATAKDTFHMLSEDWETSYPTDASLTLTNTASVADHTGQIQKNASVGNTVKREAKISKSVSAHGKVLKNGFTVEDGDCMTYTLEFTHYGKGGYENLPIVDDMYGAQALLAPADQNPHLADMGLDIYEREETEYYILTEGTYENVRIGGSDDGRNYIASDVTVEKVLKASTVQDGEESHVYTGLHTHIEWKCSDLRSGSYKMYLTYESLVNAKLADGNVYTVGNKVWMNDRINSRIYASLWGGGTVIDFNKEILEEKGQSWQGDMVDEDGYSLLNAGDEITYRMTLRSKGAGEYVVNGSDIADRLPFNGGVFEWTRDSNVELTYESTHLSTQVTDMDRWTVEKSWNGQEEEGQQYILWSDDMKITFTDPDARVYIYVTLTYPDNSGENARWSEYCRSVNGDILVNTFYVYQFPVNVTHHLGEPGRVLLQKGVYGTSYRADNRYAETQSRNYYNNKDSRSRQVNYYLVLYNGGTKRWYLNDIYDMLPDGFSFTRLFHDSSLPFSGNGNSIITKSQFDGNELVEVSQNLALPEDVVYRSALVRRIDTDESILRFQIGEGEGDLAVCYDEERGQYYLNGNEAIVFGYMCDVGLSGETKESALNTAFMYYTDYPKTGLHIVDENQTSFSGVINDVHSDQNDGSCTTITGEDVKQQYGLIQGSVEDNWLVSDVSIVRGQIIPGITKYTDSYVSSGSTLVTDYVNAAGPFDQINWRVRLHNSGTLAITDYEFKDILPAPYVFCGTVSYTIYDFLGNGMQSYTLMTVSERTEEQITITNNNSKIAVSPNGESVSINLSKSGTGSLSMEQREDGSEVLTVHFSDYSVSIPEGGYMDIYLSSYNPTNQYKNTVYTNQAVLTPKVQEFGAVGQGSLVKNENGNPGSVRNSAPVTVSFGYATGSEKAVTEAGTVDNTANSKNGEDNYILLSSEDGSFIYDLTVTNDTEKSMEKLILIDSLPAVGDVSPFNGEAPRNSEFQVSLAANPDFKVRIFTQEGEIRELTEQEYTVEYSEKDSFTEEDWDGSSQWNSMGEQAKAIRIMIHDDTGEIIPAKAKVTVSFTCAVSEEAEAGQVAWNSFGYHYKLKDLEQELEAMPLVVGVKIPEVPLLEKRLADINGNEFKALSDTKFTFVIYEGEALTEEYEQIEDMLEALKNGGIPCLVQDVMVEAGNSRSEMIPLADMSWQEGTAYTVTEFSDDPLYEFDSINGQHKKNYSFVYDKDRDTILTCVNAYLEWSVELKKTDADHSDKRLEGAVFALYSPNKEACMDAAEEYDAESTLEHNGQIWYLTDIQTTGSDGIITWNHLQEEKYYLLEVKAPDGYNRKEEGQILYWRNADAGVVSVIISNEKGIIFPITGGNGTGMYTLAGCMLGITACLMYKNNKRKERKE